MTSRTSVVFAVLASLSTAALAQPTAPVAPPPPAPGFETVAEASNWEATSLHAEVVALMDKVAAASPHARRVSMGTTVEGRDMPVIVLSDPPVSTPEEALALAEGEGRLVALLFGNIHAGEVDAKEALLMLARELALPGHPERAADADELLKKIVVCIAPIYNADGNDRIGDITVNRPGQDGPARGAGIRHNAMDLDLNRDWCKLETPEARAIVSFINAWGPHLIVDGHTTNGSYHRYLITYAGPKVPAGDPGLIEHVRDRVWPEIDRAMSERHGIDTFFYGDFEGEHGSPPRGHTKWETFPPMPRYSTGYFGLRGRLGVLSESYSYSAYRDRIAGTRAFCLELLRYCAANAETVRGLCKAADEHGARGGGEVVIRTKVAPAPGTSIVKGYAEEERNGKLVPTKEHKEYEVTVMNRYDPALAVTRPNAYVFLDEVPAVVENLSLHGLRIDTLESVHELECEVYTVSKVSQASRVWQGHALMDVEVSSARDRVIVPAGATLVRTDQPLGTLAIYLLEPSCEDGLTTWNFFDDWLVAGRRFPVARVVGRLPAKEEPREAEQDGVTGAKQ